MTFIRHFCKNGFPKVGCSGLLAGLNAEALKNALKVIYNINMPKYVLRDSVWSLALKIWEGNNNKFIEYSKTHE